MKPAVIIGGGISGLLTGHFLKKQGIDFIGLEKSAHLGGRADVGHHRLYSPDAASLLSQEFDWLKWTSIDARAEERHKGDWRESERPLEEPANFYTRPMPYFVPETPYTELVETLRDTAGRFFRTLHGVAQINPEENKLVCENGVEIEYSRIYWCTSLALLPKVWSGNKDGLAKVIKREPDSHCGISFEIDVERGAFSKNNTVIFTFRFKDKRLSAIGHLSAKSEDKEQLQWILFLEKKLFEDREEVAKCVRALKREIYKEFPELKEKAKAERIAYLPSISGETAQTTDTLDILPQLTYLGPQLRLKEVDPTYSNLDLTLHNFKSFLGEINTEQSPDAGES